MRSLLVLLLLAPAAPAQETPTPVLTGAEFARRRAALAERLGDGAIALDAGPLGDVGSDANTYIFDFRYLTGIHDDRGILVLAGGKPAVFVGDATKTAPGIESVHPVESFPEWAKRNLAGEKKVYTKLRGKNLEALGTAAPDLEVVGRRLGRELTAMRLVKASVEVDLIRKTSDATCAAHREAMAALRPGMNEKKIEELIVSTFRKHGCPELGFPPICASGKNGTILHYFRNNKEIPADTLMVIDIGAGIENYVTDITRTLPTSGKYTEEQRRHYQCVLDAQKAAEAVLRPGATFIDLERAARKVFTDRGLTKWSYAYSKDRSVLHGLGHQVGMAVHDSSFGYRSPFKAGMVVTIEPGWYDKDRNYGIRIEDIYLVTEDGFDRLSASAPREIDEIEAAMAAGREF